MRIHRVFNFLKASAKRTRPRRHARSLSTAATPLAQSHVTSGMIMAITLGVVVASANPKTTFNHCQVPCGIFDDPAVVSEMMQACTTIRKAVRQSRSLHANVGSDPLALNQMVRWINTKEEHCDRIISLVSNYCLCQRVKPDSFKSETEYLLALKVHHTVMQAAMKAKQSMDESACLSLEITVEQLRKMYTK